MADDFFKSLGGTGDLAESLLERASARQYRTQKGKKRADKIALIGRIFN